MSTLVYILIFTFLGSIASLLGGIILLTQKKLVERISHYLSAFAAGALLGAAFFDLLPESSEAAETLGIKANLFFWVLLGILFFFLVERFIYWFHHHHEHRNRNPKPIVPLVILGDGVHNFIDGVVIAASFLVSIPAGVVTAFAVAAHELPQEIGDTGILLNQGLKRTKVLYLNFFSATTALFGALLTFIMADSLQRLLPTILAATAGFFIYIAASDLIPEIHGEDRQEVAFWETMLLLFGVVVIWVVVTVLE